MSKNTTRVVTRAATVLCESKTIPLQTPCWSSILRSGSTIAAPTWRLRGMPVFRGLIGPMPEGKDVVRYESPEVFETLTKEWTQRQAHSPHTSQPHTSRRGIADAGFRIARRGAV